MYYKTTVFHQHVFSSLIYKNLLKSLFAALQCICMYVLVCVCASFYVMLLLLLSDVCFLFWHHSHSTSIKLLFVITGSLPSFISCGIYTSILLDETWRNIYNNNNNRSTKKKRVYFKFDHIESDSSENRWLIFFCVFLFCFLKTKVFIFSPTISIHIEFDNSYT